MAVPVSPVLARLRKEQSSEEHAHRASADQLTVAPQGDVNPCVSGQGRRNTEPAQGRG